MTDLLIYKQNDLPEKWLYQILSFQRIVWSEGFENENLYRDWITTPEDNPISILLTHGNLLISHVQVVSRVMKHLGTEFTLYGLTGVLTYPSFRKRGFGTQIVQEGMKYIDQQVDRDIVLYSCEDENSSFYQKCGWIFNDIPVLEGDASNPKVTKSRVAMQFVSDKAQKYKNEFLSSPLFFGDELW
ncbi:MAG: GNAT family N-acetyltransferase [Pseudomonadales bacterium]|nr:GNAT family N-acetyltransferase [Candidatus Woesebacteria bacterium]MCB9800669.1 GNAT family N-acetyltransferase [Pseudomonadales bacterium]